MVSESAAIPPELTRPTPRGARLKPNGVHMAVLAWIFLAFATGLAISEGIQIARQIQDRTALRINSQETVGVVTRTGRANSFDYSFAVDGTTFTDNARAPNAQWHQVMEDGPISVRYLPANPAIHYPAAWEWSPLLEWNPFLAIAMCLFISSVFFLSLRSDRTLVAEGEPAIGIVTKCSPWSRGGFIVRYEFRTAGGESLRGKGWPEDEYEAGAHICVLYLQRNPKRNKSYPMANYRAAG
jgi:hypothetical protein